MLPCQGARDGEEERGEGEEQEEAGGDRAAFRDFRGPVSEKRDMQMQQVRMKKRVSADQKELHGPSHALIATTSP